METQTGVTGMTTQEFADSLTAEQMARIYEIIDGKIPEEIAKMSDDELLAELVE